GELREEWRIQRPLIFPPLPAKFRPGVAQVEDDMRMFGQANAGTERFPTWPGSFQIVAEPFESIGQQVNGPERNANIPSQHHDSDNQFAERLGQSQLSDGWRRRGRRRRLNGKWSRFSGSLAVFVDE